MAADDPLVTIPLPAEEVVDQLFAQASVGVALIDRAGRYLRVNDALAAMNGLTVEEHLGRTIREVVPAAADAVEALVLDALQGRPVVDLDVAVDEHRATARRFQGSLLPVGPRGEAAGVLALLVETTESTQTRQALQLSQRRLELALEGTETGTYEWHIATDVVRWSENMGVLWGRDRGWYPPTYENYLATLHPDDRDAMAETVRLAVEEGVDYEREHRIVVPGGGVRWIHSKTHVLCDDGGRPSMLVGFVADTTARRRREISSEFLAGAGLALAGSRDVEAALREIAALAVPELGDWCVVHVSDGAGDLQAVASAHADPDRVALVDELQRRYPPEPGAPAGPTAVVASGRSELYPAISDELLESLAQGPEHLRLIRDLGMRSAMIVPLAGRGRTLGALTFAFGAAARDYGTAELELAEEVGRRAGLALENARLFEAGQEANRRLRDLQAVTDVALSHLQLDELLSRVCQVTEAEIGEVLLIDEGRGELVVNAVRGVDAAAAADVRVPIGAGIAGRIAAEGETLLLATVRAGDPIAPYLRARARSLMGVPLRVWGGDVLGVLTIASEHTAAFSAEDVALLELAADRVARGILQSRLYEQARRTAVTLQRSLLPRALPDLDGFDIAVRYIPGQSGTVVGGDFYDAFRLPDGRLGLAVGDVVGRGIEAAAAMGQLRAALRAYLHECGRPARAMELVDQLVDGLGDVTVATVALGTLDCKTGGLDLCLAGHPPPILRDSAGARRLHLAAGMPIGAPPRPRTTHHVDLAPGAALLLFSDGLVEVRTAPLDERIDALAAAVATAPDSAEALLDHALAAMLGDEEPHDDVALVGLRRR